MGYPTGTFSHTVSGKLQVTFSGEFASWVYSGTPAWSYGADAANLFIKCTAGGINTVISFGSPSNMIELDYVAGTSVSVSMELAAWSGPGGPGGVTGKKLRIRCILMYR